MLGQNPMFGKNATITVGEDDDAKSVASELAEELNPKEDFRLCGETSRSGCMPAARFPTSSTSTSLLRSCA